jgi:uncharacterized damage-inducible protein DinB
MVETHYDVAPVAGYPTDYGLFLATLDDSTREWKGELQEPSPDILCWQPYPRSYSVGGILLHIAAAEAWWTQEFSLGRKLSQDFKEKCLAPQTDVDAGFWPTPPHEPLSYYYEILDGVRARTYELVNEFEPSETVKQSRFGTMTLRWVFAHVIGHDSYHGGQAVMLAEMAKHLRNP